MRRWERLEAYLFDFDLTGGSFSVYEYAAAVGISVAEASHDIQAYLYEQRKPDGRAHALYVLRRMPGTRTRNARWAVGQRTRNVADVGRSLHSDVRRRVLRAVAPDLRQIGAINPRAAKRAERAITSIVDGALVVLEQAVEGIGEE